MSETIVTAAQRMSETTRSHISEIDRHSYYMRLTSLNALVESARAGEAGAGFAVVADEVKRVSSHIEEIVQRLQSSIDESLEEMRRLGEEGRTEVVALQSQRLVDLALNLIEIIDRNLYERSCDVRWWATDAAVVGCCTGTIDPAEASARLGVILGAYTVYHDIWICDQSGKVLATGAPARFAAAAGQQVDQQPWFRKARGMSGDGFAVDDIAPVAGLGGALAAIYAAPVRDADGQVVGVLGIFFDWGKQSQAVVDGVRLSPDEQARSRCLIVDADGLVIAASDRQGVLTERLAVPADPARGCVRRPGLAMGYALTPGFETYRGLGWRGVIIQRD